MPRSRIAVYDNRSIRRFVGIDLARESATARLNFRRVLETHELTRKIFETITAHPAKEGLIMRESTIVDATLIAVPPSTKNREQARDPEMHQAKKGRQWHSGMKAHIGVDANSGLLHTLVTARSTTASTVTVRRSFAGRCFERAAPRKTSLRSSERHDRRPHGSAL